MYANKNQLNLKDPDRQCSVWVGSESVKVVAYPPPWEPLWLMMASSSSRKMVDGA